MGGSEDAKRQAWGLMSLARHSKHLFERGDALGDESLAVRRAAAELGIEVDFRGEGTAEVGVVARVSGQRAACHPGAVIVRVDPRYFRPTEVDTLLGDASKAKARLGWTPTTTFEELVREMVECDYSAAKRDSMVKLAGFKAFDHHE